jgi:hypothetical protein
MQFIHQPLTWGFFLVLAPLLIHLINMMRHRRVKWAAMDFLLQSYKKHRKWIWLKQLLLLLSRMAAVAVLVAMLAQWITRGQWLDLFGGTATHHYVLLDDSYSMSDRMGGASAFENALDVVHRIGKQAAAQDTPQRFTLIRFSRAARNAPRGDEEADVPQVADYHARLVDPKFDVTLEEKRNTFQVTEFAVGPLPALSLLRQLFDQTPDERRLVYVVSDFRAGQWENPAEAREVLREIQRSGAELHLVSCARTAHQNLGVIDVAPAKETRAAGVPLFVDVQVKNFAADPVRNVQLKVRTVFCDPEAEQAATPQQFAGKADDLPTVLIDEILPGQTATRRVQVFFPKPGRHVVTAALPDDPVAADNHRWCVIDFPEGEPVLIVDGSQEQRHAYFLESVFKPGGRANTGIQPDINTPAFLRDAGRDALQKYRVIYLLDVSRLDELAVANLTAYVRGGGGLAFFVGPNVNLAFYNTALYQNGEGLFPLPLAREDQLPPPLEEEVPDIEVSDHPMFSVFLGERNPFIRLIRVDRYLRPPDDWKPAPDSSVQLAALLRNKMPLAVERRLGEGRVMAILTTLSPDWNNWGNDPSFVVAVLRMQSHLASAYRNAPTRLVGTPLTVQMEAEKYRRDLQFTVPGETPESRIVVERAAAKTEPTSPLMAATIGDTAVAGTGDTDRSGVYEAWPITTAGQPDVRRFAINVDANEGDLTVVDGQTLLARLHPVKGNFRYADEYVFDLAGVSGSNRSLLLMMLLLGLLLAEQVLAYSASYHPPRREA